MMTRLLLLLLSCATLLAQRTPFKVNGTVVNNPNLTNSPSITWSINGINITGAAAGGGGGDTIWTTNVDGTISAQSGNVTISTNGVVSLNGTSILSSPKDSDFNWNTTYVLGNDFISGSDVSQLHFVYSVGEANLGSSFLTNASYLFAFGELVLDSTTVDSSYDIYGMGISVFRNAIITNNSYSIFGLGAAVGGEVHLDNVHKLVAIGPSALETANLANSENVVAIGQRAGYGLTGSFQSVMMIGEDALVTQDHEIAFGSAPSIYTFPGTADSLTVITEAYDATGWEGNNTVPTKDAIRDKIESLGSGQIRAPDGSQAAPGLSFTSEPDSGLYVSGPGVLNLSIDNTRAAILTSSQIGMPANLGVGWYSVGFSSFDTVLFRDAPGIVKVTQAGGVNLGGFKAGTLTLTPAANTTALTVNGSVTGSATGPTELHNTTFNSSGVVIHDRRVITNTASATGSAFTSFETSAGGVQAKVGIAGDLTYNLRATKAVAGTIASAATIAPTSPITFISGTTGIDTITAPSPISATGGSITLIPTGTWATSTSGNIALVTTAVVSKALIMTYDQATAKWYPSY